LNTVNSEMEMQKQLLDSLCVSSGSASDVTAAKYEFFPPRTTLNYAYYLMDISSSGTFSEIMSVMAPCPWTYLEIAQELSKNPITNEAYRKWVKFYSSAESRREVTEIKNILSRVGERVDEKSRAKMKHHFVKACKYEYLFLGDGL
jgi:thiaminase (transcriptional activator TenA)